MKGRCRENQGQGPYGQPPYGQPPQGYGYNPHQQYGAPAYGYGGPPPGFQAPRDHPSGTTALTLGLLSVFCLGPITGIPAVLLGGKVLREVAAAPHQYRCRRARRSAEI